MKKTIFLYFILFYPFFISTQPVKTVVNLTDSKLLVSWQNASGQYSASILPGHRISISSRGIIRVSCKPMLFIEYGMDFDPDLKKLSTIYVQRLGSTQLVCSRSCP